MFLWVFKTIPILIYMYIILMMHTKFYYCIFLGNPVITIIPLVGLLGTAHWFAGFWVVQACFHVLLRRDHLHVTVLTPTAADSLLLYLQYVSQHEQRD